MKIIRSLLLIGFLIMTAAGCGRKDGAYNPYYDRMKKLAEEAKANPSDRHALDKLKRYADGSDYWDRSYACGSLAELAIQNVGGYRAELIPIFDKLLKDPDPELRRRGAETILSIGPAAVDKTVTSLVAIVQRGTEDDVTWFSTQALGQLENREKAQQVLPILLKAAGTPPPNTTPDSAPQIRYCALDAITQLAAKNKLDVLSQLRKLLNSSSGPFKERVTKAILKLDRQDSVAQ
jgi:hypothetical protein